MATTNARPRDARAGYTLYREAGGDLDRVEMNRRLFEAGYGPVSDRMMAHYRHLAEANYDRYISINRFDVARAATRYEDLGASPRYRYTDVGEGVRMLIAKGNKLWTAAAQVTRIGEAGAIVRLVDAEYDEGLAAVRVRPGDFVSLRFLESGRSADGRIVEVDADSSPPLLEVQFTSLVSLADFAVGASIPTAQLGMRVRSDDDIGYVTTDQLGRRLFLLFEIVDEVRYLANLASQRSVGPTAGYSPPALVERLSVASPAETILAVSELVKAIFPVGVVASVLGVLAKAPELRKTWFEGTGVALDNDAKRAAAKELSKEKDAAIAELARSIRTQLDERLDIPADFGDELENLAIDRLTPLLDSLADAGVELIEEIDASHGSDGDDASHAESAHDVD